jgi:hypothetical protein
LLIVKTGITGDIERIDFIELCMSYPKIYFFVLSLYLNMLLYENLQQIIL